MNSLSPAGFFPRLVAYLIEKLIFFLVVFWLVFKISQSVDLKGAYFGLIVLLVTVVFYAVIGLIYSVLFTHLFGGDLGKLITGLRIKDQAGDKLSFKRILFRQLMSYRFSSMLFGVGYLAVLRNTNKQAWHDQTVDGNVFKVQPLLPLGLVVLLLLGGSSVYLAKASFDNFIKSPVKQEVMGLVADFNQEKVNSSQLASLLSANGQVDETAKLLSQMSPQLAQGFIDTVSLLSSQKYDDVINAANKLQPEVKSNADKAFIDLILVQAYLGKKDSANAQKYAEALVKDAPDFSYGYRYMAEFNLAMKDYPEAVKNTQRAVSLNQNQPYYHYLLSVALSKNGQANDALVEIKKAVELDPTNSEYQKEFDFQQTPPSPSLKPMVKPFAPTITPQPARNQSGIYVDPSNITAIKKKSELGNDVVEFTLYYPGTHSLVVTPDDGTIGIYGSFKDNNQSIMEVHDSAKIQVGFVSAFGRDIKIGSNQVNLQIKEASSMIDAFNSSDVKLNIPVQITVTE